MPGPGVRRGLAGELWIVEHRVLFVCLSVRAIVESCRRRDGSDCLPRSDLPAWGEGSSSSSARTAEPSCLLKEMRGSLTGSLSLQLPSKRLKVFFSSARQACHGNRGPETCGKKLGRFFPSFRRLQPLGRCFDSPKQVTRFSLCWNEWKGLFEFTCVHPSALEHKQGVKHLSLSVWFNCWWHVFAADLL